MEIDKENRRLSLGHKQLEENPWDVFETVFTVGSVHEGTIIEMLDKGAVVLLATGTSAQTKELAGALVPVVSAVFLYLIMTIVAP